MIERKSAFIYRNNQIARKLRKNKFHFKNVENKSFSANDKN